MAESKNRPVPDENITTLHDELVKVLGDPQQDRAPDEPYWDANSTTFQDDFEARLAEQLGEASLAELRKAYADRPVPPSGDSQADDKKANS